MHSQKIRILITLYFIFLLKTAANAFDPGFPCSDLEKYCAEGAEFRYVEGVKIYKPCWKYGYIKKCSIPSKDDCNTLSHCYEIGLKDCLLRDRYGNCVNQQKEFSCKRRESNFLEEKKVKYKPTGEEAREIVCKGVPCVDGNCIDKSYDMDADMMKSVSQLYAASKTAGAKDLRFQLFQGFGQHCTKKPADYTNCCKTKGWGTSLGAKCNNDERSLQDLRHKNLCVYVGKSTSGTSPFHVNKHHFCCFGNMLNKVFQVEARKQLGMTFGSGGSPDCRGLTLDEVMKLDFEKIDFSEFVAEIKSKMKVPNIADIETRVKSTGSDIKKFDDRLPHAEMNPANKRSGVNSKTEKSLSDEGYYVK